MGSYKIRESAGPVGGWLNATQTGLTQELGEAEWTAVAASWASSRFSSASPQSPTLKPALREGGWHSNAGRPGSSALKIDELRGNPALLAHFGCACVWIEGRGWLAAIMQVYEYARVHTLPDGHKSRRANAHRCRTFACN